MVDPWRFTRVIFSDTEPTILPTWEATDWKWFNTTDHRWYELVGGSWVLRDVPVGVDLAHDGEKMEITKLTIVDGIITEIEYGT